MTGEGAAVVERRKRFHLWSHLTDGRWHDDCPWCQYRRLYGGNGLQAGPLVTPPDACMQGEG